MNSYKRLALESLMNRAVTDKLESKTSLRILLDHPAGIGDHSTSDLHNNLNEALSKLADAEDRIETLIKYYPSWFSEVTPENPAF